MPESYTQPLAPSQDELTLIRGILQRQNAGYPLTPDEDTFLRGAKARYGINFDYYWPEAATTPAVTAPAAAPTTAGGGATTPGMTVGAGATAPITAAGTITPERQVEPSGGWQTPSREVEPAGGWQTPAPSTTPSATAAPTAPTPKFGYGAIPEAAAPNFAEIISRMTEKELEVLRLILAAMSGGRPSPVAVPSPPSTFSQALAR